MKAPKRAETLRMSDSAEPTVLHKVRNGHGGEAESIAGEEKWKAGWGEEVKEPAMN